MKTTLRVASAFLAVSVGSRATAAEPVENPIFAKGAKLELLHNRDTKLNSGQTEGPAVAPDGSIYFTDMPFGKGDGMILRFDPKGGKTSVFTDKAFKSNGLALTWRATFFLAMARTAAVAAYGGGTSRPGKVRSLLMLTRANGSIRRMISASI